MAGGAEEEKWTRSDLLDGAHTRYRRLKRERWRVVDKTHRTVLSEAALSE